MSENTRAKIRKLLALGADGTNEHISRMAFEKAHELMRQQGITEVGEDSERIQVLAGDWMEGTLLKANWHKNLAGHIARLYGCSAVHAINEFEGLHRFYGMRHQIEACEETFLFVVDQIEGLYKIALKAFDGQLTKMQRAELRASFKDAATLRVGVRISKILNNRQPEGTALVIVDTVKDQINAMFEEEKVGKKEIAVKEGFGSGAGFNAGGLVQIQKEIKP